MPLFSQVPGSRASLDKPGLNFGLGHFVTARGTDHLFVQIILTFLWITFSTPEICQKYCLLTLCEPPGTLWPSQDLGLPLSQTPLPWADPVPGPGIRPCSAGL